MTHTELIGRFPFDVRVSSKLLLIDASNFTVLSFSSAFLKNLVAKTKTRRNSLKQGQCAPLFVYMMSQILEFRSN